MEKNLDEIWSWSHCIVTIADTKTNEVKETGWSSSVEACKKSEANFEAWLLFFFLFERGKDRGSWLIL